MSGCRPTWCPGEQAVAGCCTRVALYPIDPRLIRPTYTEHLMKSVFPGTREDNPLVVSPVPAGRAPPVAGYHPWTEEPPTTSLRPGFRLGHGAGGGVEGTLPSAPVFKGEGDMLVADSVTCV